MAQNFTEIANFLWMPFALSRRLDCVLESTKDGVLLAAMQGMMAAGVYKAFRANGTAA